MDEDYEREKRLERWRKADPNYVEPETWQDEIENAKDKRIKELERQIYVLKKRRYKVK